MKPIADMSAAEAEGIRYVLMDIDDTLTKDGKLLASSYNALWELKGCGLKVIPVTGRPAGWCDCIVREWPVDAVIGENGAMAFWEEESEPGRPPVLKSIIHPNAVRNDHPVLKRIRERAITEIPRIREAKDQFARLFDLALDFAEEEPVLPLSAAERVRTIACDEGAMAKISSIHVNVWMGNYDKLSMASYFLNRRYGWNETVNMAGKTCLDEVVFVGDSPNDEPMFARFPLACAVANIRRYEKLIKNLPAFVASKEYGDGFAEIAKTIIRKSGLISRG
ncbi:MAG: HAD-IIB family hydrolase [Treponema sp.]|jgi:HAD superfamily hydrolase (TIGR01484 family)|nr:HAD-IIB family hydrolase [Treponema sp.]